MKDFIFFIATMLLAAGGLYFTWVKAGYYADLFLFAAFLIHSFIKNKAYKFSSLGFIVAVFLYWLIPKL
jgi:hypothetical protein